MQQGGKAQLQALLQHQSGPDSIHASGLPVVNRTVLQDLSVVIGP